MRDALWVGKRRRHEKTDNRKPEVRTAATLVLVREGLELEYCSGTGGNFRLSHAASRHICMAHVITQPQKLHSQIVGLNTAVCTEVAGLMCSFIYHMGLQPAGKIHNNLAGYVHLLLFFHVRPTNQPTIMGVDL